MRFMLLLKTGSCSAEALCELFRATDRFNAQMVRAGVLLDAARLVPASNAMRVRFAGEPLTVADLPAPEACSTIAGYWMIQVKSKEEAIEWARRCPLPQRGDATEIELRQVVEDDGRSSYV